MSEQSEVKTPQQPILPWHREAAKEIHPWELRNEGDGTIEEMELAYDENEANMNEDERVAAIIARHDPHTETLRLLGDIDAEIQGAMNNAFPEDAPDILDGIGAKIRAHLAATKGTT